jgi:hypothetical protein
VDRDDFLHPENWRGGPSYDLSMAWAPGDDARLLKALRALAAASGLRGPWASPSHFPVPTAPPMTLDRESGYKGYGLLRLRDGTEVGCLLLAFLSGHDPKGDDANADWLELAVMRGMQERAFGVVYSDHFRQDNPWLAQLDAHYLALAEAVYSAAPFTFAVIDHEGLHFGSSPQAIIAAQIDRGGLLLPPPTFARVALHEGWVTLRSGLRWFPPREK